jgi:Rieske Fe-S protein
VGVNEYLNLQLPSNQTLNYPGNYMIIGGGHRGIVVYHNIDDTYIAFDRTCSYKASDACSKLTPDSSGFFLGCGSYDASKVWIPCCDSRFQFDGTITRGPAIYPLKRYNTSLDGSVLHIFN